MTWAHPTAIAVIPLALIMIWWLFHRARRGEVMARTNIKQLWANRHGLLDAPSAHRRRLLRGACLAIGSIAALLALARPQWGEIAEPRYDVSREVMLALDLSRSMLADDVAPSRLARAKLLIDSLLDQLKGERVGLIVFSGTAFVQSPLSADYEVLRDLLSDLDPSYLPEGGTDYESMLRTATQAYSQQDDSDRYLVVLSDGEALDAHWQSLVPALRERGIHVIGLGIGTPQGALVPDGHGGLVKDERGAAVLSRLEPGTLRALAEQTGGTYRDAATWVDVAQLIDATVDQGRKGQFVEQRSVRLQDRYQWFLAAALLFFLLSYWLELPPSPLARALPTRGRRPHPASAPAIAAALMALAAWHTPRLAWAAVSEAGNSASDTASQPNPLAATVAQLSAKAALDVGDYALLANETIHSVPLPGVSVQQARLGMLDDGLDAVARGEQLDAHAADWGALRRQLEQLKQMKAEPPKQSPQQNQHAGDPPSAASQNDSQPQHGTGAAEGGHDHASGQRGGDQTSASRSDSASGTGQSPPSENSEPRGASGATGGDQNTPGAGNDAAASAPPPSAEDAGRGGAPHQDHPARTASGEVPRADDVPPLEDQQPAGADGASVEQATGKEDASPASPTSRMVGGGRAVQVAPQGATALAEAIDKLERVKDGDAPAVLFDRMNRAEGQPPRVRSGKNW